MKSLGGIVDMFEVRARPHLRNLLDQILGNGYSGPNLLVQATLNGFRYKRLRFPKSFRSGGLVAIDLNSAMLRKNRLGFLSE